MSRPGHTSRPAPTALARRRRHAARLALYASLALVAAAAWGLLLWLRPSLGLDEMLAWTDPELAAHPEVERLREYVAIDTSTPHGDQLAGALWFAGEVRALGLEPVVERVGEEANVWAVLEGEVPEAVVLHHHVDVDPVPRPEDWELPPFAGVIDGPWLYGRGAFDMKSVAIAQLAAVRDLVAAGRRPHRSVILLATTGEEVGSDLGTRWFLARHPELVARFAVVLTEGGAVEGTQPGVAKFWGTEVAQSRLVRVTACAGDRQRLADLAADLAAVGVAGEPRLAEEVAWVLPDYAATRDDADYAAALADPASLLRDRATFLRLPPYLRAFFLDVGQVGRVREAPGGGFELPIQLLLLPGTTVDDAVERLLPAWIFHGVSLQVADERAAEHGTSPEHWAFAALDRLMAERLPGSPHGPLYLPLTLTDARFFRAAGVPTLGFTPFNVLTPEVRMVRRGSTVNERIPIHGFLEGIELYRAVVRRLAE